MSDLNENGLWAAMLEDDKVALAPHVVVRHLPKGDVLMRRGDEVDRVYFPLNADVTNVPTMSDGHAAMASNVGREGVTGLAAFLAEQPLGWDLSVQVAGDAITLPARPFRKQAEASRHLADLLMKLTHGNQIEAAQNAVCNSLHSTEERISRWILTTQDRIGRTEFMVNQEELGLQLGVQRTTINAIWQDLRSAGGVEGTRGRMRVVDRAVLFQRTCECYEAIADAYAPFRGDGI